MNKYTGRQIAIFTDIHALLEPTVAILDDIRKRGIREIYSLGDSIGVGPNPSEVLDLLIENNVKMINGNSEDYVIIGIAPFGYVCFNPTKVASHKWTLSRLRPDQIAMLKGNLHSYDLKIGGMNIGLCHFANDVRIDFGEHSTWSYQSSINNGIEDPQRQFYYTNSDIQKEEIEAFSQVHLPKYESYRSAKKDPLFGGKTIDAYDEIIQGHVHFKFLTEDEKVKIRTIRALGMAYKNDPIDYASYIIIREKEIGYDVEEILVPFNRDLMLKSIDDSTMPDKSKINRFVSRR